MDVKANASLVDGGLGGAAAFPETAGPATKAHRSLNPDQS